MAHNSAIVSLDQDGLVIPCDTFEGFDAAPILDLLPTFSH